jgi:methyl-accepting chemotaxis protein
MRRIPIILFEFCQWLTRELWWLILPAFLWFAHIFLVVHILNLGVDGEFSKLVFLVAQIIGVSLVLKSINSNLKLFGSSLKEMAIDGPLSRMPRLKKKKGRTVTCDGTLTSIIDGHVSISTMKAPLSLEEKVDHLTQKISQLEENYKSEFNDIRILIREKDSSLNQKVKSIRSDIKDIESKTKKMVVEGVDEAIFGILVAMHGSFVEVIFPIVKRAFFP